MSLSGAESGTATRRDDFLFLSNIKEAFITIRVNHTYLNVSEQLSDAHLHG